MNTTHINPSKRTPTKPPPVSHGPHDDAKAEWLYNAAEQLVRYGSDVLVHRRMRKPQGVTMEQYVLAVDEHVNNRLADCEVDSPALARLLISASFCDPDKTAIAELLGPSGHPLGKLGEIAETLLKPLADDALIAHAEDSL